MKNRLSIRITAYILALIMCFACASCGAEAEPPEKKLAKTLLADMTLEEKIGQLFLVCEYGCTEEELASIAEQGAGGVLLFADFFEEKTPEEVSESTAKLQSASKYPLFIGIDEEGGEVTRVSCFPQFRDEAFASPRELMENGGASLVKQDTAEKCRLLLKLGINLNLAPVSDVSTDEDDFIYSRSAGDKAAASDYVRAFIEESNADFVGSCLKHFPGYGDNDDTHTGVSVDKRKLESFQKTDFVPISAGIEAGAGMVLVSHNTVTCMDSENPASLSEEVHRILREELGFDGIIITDDLSMDAIAEHFGAEKAAVTAIECGNDMLITSEFKAQYDAILKAVRDGIISEERIDESVLRVLEYKIRLGIIAEK